MGTYHWVTAQSIGDPSNTDDPTGAWRTPDDLAVRTLSVPSPVGLGDVLVRTEVSVNLRANFAEPSLALLFPQSAVSQFIGDVGIHDGETLDPRGPGEYEFAFSWDGIWRWSGVAYGVPTLASAASWSCTTGGYVTSKARRGPDKYGAIDPAFNLSVFTWGSDYYRTSTTGVTSAWVITARCLWFTP